MERKFDQKKNEIIFTLNGKKRTEHIVHTRIKWQEITIEREREKERRKYEKRLEY